MQVPAIFNARIRIPEEKKFWYFLIVFTTVFNLFFLNTFLPFNINTWRNDAAFEQLLHLSGFAILGGAVLTLSHCLLQLLEIRQFALKTYLLRYFVELLIMSVVFILYQEGDWLPSTELLKEVPISFKYSLLSTILPYSLCFLLFRNLTLKEKNQPIVEKEPIVADQEKFFKGMIGFRDERNQLQFSISADQVIYLEAADNYLYVYCVDKGQETKHLLRNTLKNMELLLAGSALKRCHRSYMVNEERVRFVRYEKSKCLLSLHGTDQVIPVSNRYLSAFGEINRP